MAIPFTDIAVPFSERGLNLPTLNALVPNGDPYEVLAIQPSNTLTFSTNFIGAGDRPSAQKKFDSFLALANEKQPDVALSPEYSLPWQALLAALKQGRRPALGKLWAFGCESITPSELGDLQRQVPDIIWIYEAPQINARQFLDPVCYFLKTTTLEGQTKDVALLQFKTLPMAGGQTFERDHLISGSKRYFLRNRDQDFLRFYTFICSEALEFELSQNARIEYEQHPAIVFHPQLIDDARHPSIRKYRTDLFIDGCSDHVEVLSLNWARQIQAIKEPPSVKGNSALFMKSEKFNTSDEELHKNHALGLHYCYWESQRTHLCLFNFDEHIFHFTTQKVKRVGAAVQRNRTGPQMLSLFRWDSGSGTWAASPSGDDGFLSLCQSYDNERLKAFCENKLTVSDRERLLLLCAGSLKNSKDWYQVYNLPSFVAEADERSKRLTFAHEQHAESRRFRSDHITRFIELNAQILPDSSKFPESIFDLAGNYELVAPSPANGFRFNVVNKTTGLGGATVIFVGTQPTQAARALRDKITVAWGNDQSGTTTSRM